MPITPPNPVRGGGNLEILALRDIKWREFGINKVFEVIKRGKRLIKRDHQVGQIPYVSSTAFNNGVDDFIGNQEGVRKFKNCISLANSGSVGKAFFHPYEFIASDHTTQLINKNFSPYIYMFLLHIIQRFDEKYFFNREISDARIKREVLLLPIDSDGNPNWQFMEDYMRMLEVRQLKSVLIYYENKLA